MSWHCWLGNNSIMLADSSHQSIVEKPEAKWSKPKNDRIMDAQTTHFDRF